ncbi:MAG: ferredoxin family protein [Clostridia bacterium]|nr:ferredoxin family protein [Clostridia bacterium]
MSKTWYPMIDYEKCIECGACIAKCKNGVYDKQSTLPIVVNPDNCIQGCTGCGKLCPVGAIEYFGDNKAENNENCSCGCGNCGCGGKC